MWKDTAECHKIAEKAITIVYEWFSSLSQSWHAPFTIRVAWLKSGSTSEDKWSNLSLKDGQSNIEQENYEWDGEEIYSK